MTFDDKRRSYNRRIGIVLLLPCAITQHSHRRCRSLIITGRKGAAGESPNPESRKIISGNEFAAQRFRHVIAMAPAHAKLHTRRLERGHLIKLRGGGLHPKK